MQLENNFHETVEQLRKWKLWKSIIKWKHTPKDESNHKLWIQLNHKNLYSQLHVSCWLGLESTSCNKSLFYLLPQSKSASIHPSTDDVPHKATNRVQDKLLIQMGRMEVAVIYIQPTWLIFPFWLKCNLLTEAKNKFRHWMVQWWMEGEVL